MTQEEHIKYWLDSARNDLETLDALYEACKFDWSLFVGHFVLEKTLKALYVQKHENKIPPKLHNPVRLAELTIGDLSENKKLLLDEINDFHIEVRYPEYKNEFYKIGTKEFAE